MTYNTNDIPELTYSFAVDYLAGRSWRTLSNNTQLVAVSVHTTHHGTWGGFAVRLHSTNIVTLTGPENDPDRFYFLDFDGWWTTTTLQRANAVLPSPRYIGALVGHGISLYSAKGTLYIAGRNYSTGDHWSHPYHDGFVIDRETNRPTFGTLHAGTDDIFQSTRKD